MPAFIRPTVETILAAILIAGGPALLVFGLLGIPVMLFEQPRWLWDRVPNVLPSLGSWQPLVAMLSVMAGCYFAAGIWTAYPAWRTPLVILTAVFCARLLWVLLLPAKIM